MASVVTYRAGLRRIDYFVTPNGTRKSVRLGRVTVKVAESWKAKIEAIIADKLAGRAHEPELSRWLGSLDEKMLSRLRSVGLASGVGLSDESLGAFLTRFFAAFTGKTSTKIFCGHTRRNLEEYFTPGRPIRTITPADADAFKAWLVDHENLAKATVARRIIAARTMWRRAIRWKLVAENPFEGIKAGHQANDSRKFFIQRDVIDKVMAEAPDTEWKLIIALSRYGGLRCPSEHFALRWGDIDFEKRTIRVTCPKLAHVESCAQRIIPLFPELHGLLLMLFDEAPDGTEYVISRHRLGSQNLRSTFQRMIGRAGLKPWPRLFHNLRASRETELMREFDFATVCRWIGNSPRIAAAHYVVSIDLDADFKRAAGLELLPLKAQQKAQQSASSDDCHAVAGKPLNVEKALENREFDHCGQSLTDAGKEADWAMQDSNTLPHPRENNIIRKAEVRNPVHRPLILSPTPT